MKNKVLIIGSGRSGTHWLAKILKSNKSLKVLIEFKPIFNLVTYSAINYKKKKVYLPIIIFFYKLLFLFYKNLVDKSHPNIWHAHEIKKQIKDVKFLGIYRDPLATVSSMLKHNGVRRWCEDWDKYPVPNKMLGIETNFIEQYKNLEIEEKCAIRVISHYRELKNIKNIYPNDTLLIKYEDLFNFSDRILNQISLFLNIKTSFGPIKTNLISKEKWKKELTQTQINNIKKTIQLYGEDVKEMFK